LVARGVAQRLLSGFHRVPICFTAPQAKAAAAKLPAHFIPPNKANQEK